MEFINKIKTQFSDANQKFATYLANGGIQDLYRKIYVTRQFPIFFFIQVTWCSFVIRNTHKDKKTTILSKLLQLITAFLMTFGSREVMAFVFHEKSPLLTRPITALYFLGVWLVINFSPFDIVYKLLNIASFILCPAQCSNQVRLLIRVESHMKKGNYIPMKYRLPFTLAIINFEFIIERFMSVITKGKKSSMSNLFTILLTSAGIFGYMSATRTTKLTKYIGRHEPKLSALVLGLALAAVAYMRRIFELSTSLAKPKQDKNEDLERDAKDDKNEDLEGDIKDQVRKLYQQSVDLKDVAVQKEKEEEEEEDK